MRTILIIKLPFIYKNTGFRRKGLYLNENKLMKYITLNTAASTELTNIFNSKFKQGSSLFRFRLNKNKLALEYKDLLEKGVYGSKAELARSLGFSRAWITKVMNTLKE